MHTSAPTNLPGREIELKKLEDFLCDHLEKEKSGTLYVSGPPGTGKTACLTKILQHPKVNKKGYSTQLFKIYFIILLCLNFNRLKRATKKFMLIVLQ